MIKIILKKMKIIIDSTLYIMYNEVVLRKDKKKLQRKRKKR
jgi:hypothetical protein